MLDSVIVEAGNLNRPSEETGQYRPPASQTATGLTLSAQETPQSLSVVTHQQMEDFGLDDAN
ncbi:MAG TPA: hypothetical protein ENO19_09470, partial [Halothiobacillaceae bacterium]|nr:hypothetical protein [Halothiobacillaceae bacterium]